MRKLKVLSIGETSILNTGFATYSCEVLKRLHVSDQFELAEFGCYAEHNDQRIGSIPWKFYNNSPNRADQNEVNAYDSKPTNQFGDWRFESVLLDFKPDIVWSIRDPWMDSFIAHSPLRRCYKWVYMPTIDGFPIDPEWLDMFGKADTLLTYTDWGLELLRKYFPGAKCSAPAGVDFNVFRPLPKKELKAMFGLSEDSLIVGMVARNQKRKLFPDLIEAFKIFLERAPEDLARRSYLYLHTAYPDIGWHIPRLINESGIGHKILVTYHCRTCNNVFANHYQDAKGVCQRCGNINSFMPSSGFGIDREALAVVYNLFDLYIQYASNEGQGIPAVEAAGCGVPVFAIDYSAMSDVVRKLNGKPLEPLKLMRECETHRYLAVPNNEDLADKMISFLLKPYSLRAKAGREAREGALANYSYDKTAQIWSECFQSFDLQRGFWNDPPHIYQPNFNCPEGLNDEQFVSWALSSIAGRPDLVGSYLAMRMSRDLMWGLTHSNPGSLYFNESSVLGTVPRAREYTRNDVAREAYEICEKSNFWERERGSNS